MSKLIYICTSSRWLMSRRSWRSSGSSGLHFLRPSVRRSMWRLQKALRTTAGTDTTRAGKTSAIKLLHSCGCEDSLHNRSRHSLHIYFVTALTKKIWRCSSLTLLKEFIVLRNILWLSEPIPNPKPHLWWKKKKKI